MQRGNTSAESPGNQQNYSDKYHCFSLTSIILFKKAGGRVCILAHHMLAFCTSRAGPCTFVLSSDYYRPNCVFIYFFTI